MVMHTSVAYPRRINTWTTSQIFAQESATIVLPRRLCSLESAINPAMLPYNGRIAESNKSRALAFWQDGVGGISSGVLNRRSKCA
jgi:hypothetical protein